MNIERSLATQGWLMESEATYLASVASKSRLIVEVGSWMGRSTCALAANAGEGMVFAVDTWKGSSEHAGQLAAKPEGWLFSEFRRNTQGLPIVPVPLPSLDAAFLFAKTSIQFDAIFLDASHDYDSVKSDILAWTPLLRPNGILCGHDYDPPHWMGVMHAVEECVPKFRIVPGTTLWTTEGA